jgi:hypothetical protein
VGNQSFLGNRARHTAPDRVGPPCTRPDGILRERTAPASPAACARHVPSCTSKTKKGALLWFIFGERDDTEIKRGWIRGRGAETGTAGGGNSCHNCNPFMEPRNTVSRNKYFTGISVWLNLPLHEAHRAPAETETRFTQAACSLVA